MTTPWPEIWKAIDSVPGWLSEEEARTLYNFARVIEPELNVVELGAFMGRSTVALAAGLRDRPDRARGFVISVDTWQGTRDSSDEELHRQMMRERGVTDLYRLHRDTMQSLGLSHFVRRIRGRSSVEAIEFAADWKLEIGLLFIDARHDYESVLEDFTRWTPLVQSGGFIVFHDKEAYGPARVISEAPNHFPNLLRISAPGSLAVFSMP